MQQLGPRPAEWPPSFHRLALSIPGTPAARAGLVPADVIVSIGGHAVTSAMSLRSVMDTYRPGDTASLHRVDQAGQAHTATIVFTAGPAG